ncbi:hypothetical protein H2248_000166 [Termitomyces sp. 'cryptogamus']|nr:hypothetical protein H2248_000166 [Termitomyces sp. 'cryptogamus']
MATTYYLSNELVDYFAHEVKKPHPNALDNVHGGMEKVHPDSSDNASGDVGTEESINPDDSATTSALDDNARDPSNGTHTNLNTPYATTWKATTTKANKKMWAIFNESGIFVNMVCSGKLFKYPLAIIAKALDVLPPGFLSAYDVGCILDGTIDRSSLGTLFKECTVSPDFS